MMILTTQNAASSRRVMSRARRRERGYMMISLIFIAAALPSLKHEMQREREEEMFYRQEQVANAITLFQKDHGGQFPTSLDQLTELNPASQSKRYLRKSATKDPMTLKGEWKLVRMGDPALKDLALAYISRMKLQNPQQLPQILVQAMAVTPGSLSLGDNNSGLSSSQDSKDKDEGSKLGGEFGPFVGVVSKSKEHLIRDYFGIETYDKAVVVPGVATPGQILIPGLL